MANLLYTQPFTGQSITVTHNLDRLNIESRVVCSGKTRSDLVNGINFTNGNERNEFVMTLTTSNVGNISLFDNRDFPINLPTPENNVKLVDVLENEFLLDIYQSGTTTQLNNSTYTSIGWDAQSIVGSNYTHGGTDIRINSSGTYQITYSISSEFNTNSNQRRMVRSRLSIGGVEIPRSGGYSYHRRTAESEGTITKTIITPLPVETIVTLDAIISTPTGGDVNNISTIVGDSNITITKLNNG